MRSATLLGVLFFGLALASACNDNSVAGNPSPTPTGPTPTPTATSNGSWTLHPAAPLSQACGASGISETLPAVLTIPIDTSGANFIPDWGLAADGQVGTVGIVNPEAGTVSGTTFNASWDYCRFDGFLTYRKEWTWTGTLTGGGTAFTGSTMTEILHYGNGDVRASCVTAAITPLANCSSPGLTWTLDGTKN